MTAETLVGKANNLQAPSPTVVRLLSLLNSPDADYDEVIRTVGCDAVLSAKLIAVCNSASYGLAKPVGSVEQGVLILGYGEIHRLVMALNFASQLGTENSAYSMDAGTLWRHSLVTAQLTPRIVARARNGGADTSIAYTAGLLHDIGKIVIGQTLASRTRDEIRRQVEEDGISLLKAEKAVIGCDHAEVGGCLLRKWRIPGPIAEAAAWHHTPRAGGAGNLSAAVHIADAITHQIGASPGWKSFAVTIDETAITSLGLSAGDLDALTIVAFDLNEEICKHEDIGMPAKPAEDLAECAF